MENVVWEFQYFVECEVVKLFVWLFWIDVFNWECLEGKVVEWIKINGFFVVGIIGEIKMLEQLLQFWIII